MGLFAFALPILSPILQGEGVREQLWGCLAAGWSQPTTVGKSLVL